MAPAVPSQDALLQQPARPALGFGEPPKAAGAHRAEAPRAPKLPSNLQRAEAEHAAELLDREVLERRSMLRGLIFLAWVVLLVGLLHAGLGRVFFPGWWRRW